MKHDRKIPRRPPYERRHMGIAGKEPLPGLSLEHPLSDPPLEPRIEEALRQLTLVERAQNLWYERKVPIMGGGAGIALMYAGVQITESGRRYWQVRDGVRERLDGLSSQFLSAYIDGPADSGGLRRLSYDVGDTRFAIGNWITPGSRSLLETSERALIALARRPYGVDDRPELDAYLSTMRSTLLDTSAAEASNIHVHGNRLVATGVSLSVIGCIMFAAAASKVSSYWHKK
jgi:hypothetical protein